MLDVAIVGAGPVGNRAAYRLAQMGHSVSVIEKKSSHDDSKCCTGIISHECITKFNIPPEIIYRKISGAKLYSPSGEFLPITQLASQASVVNRNALDNYLGELARKQGVEYLFNTKVEYLNRAEDRVTLFLKANNIVSTVEAKTVILACGFHAPLVRKSGFGQSRYFTTGVQAEVRKQSLEEIEIYFGNLIAPGFFAWLVPTYEDWALAGLMTHKKPGYYLKKWLWELEKNNKIIRGNRSFNYAGIPMRPLYKTYSNRLLVVGDAAGQVKPTTGGGIYFGLLCADIAAETLHNGIIQNQLSEHYLSNYQSKWKHILNHELNSEYFSRRIFEKLSDHNINRLFAAAKSDNLAENVLSKTRISFDWHGGSSFRLFFNYLKAAGLITIKKVFTFYKHAN